MTDGPREIHPVQFFDADRDLPGVTKDFRPQIVRNPDPVEKEEVEAVLETAPKDSSVPESVISKDSPPPTAPSGSETPVPPVGQTLQGLDEDADKESGKVSELSEAEQTTQPTPSPVQENSSQPSSSATSPGWPTPPAPVRPPI